MPFFLPKYFPPTEIPESLDESPCLPLRAVRPVKPVKPVNPVRPDVAATTVGRPYWTNFFVKIMIGAQEISERVVSVTNIIDVS